MNPFSRPPLSRSKRLTVKPGTAEDATPLAALHTSVAEELTRLHGRGTWSSKTSEKGILFALRTSRVFVAREGADIVATFRLATKKPWAIDTSYFSPCSKALYLLGMAVTPPRQGHGIGRKCLEEAVRIARTWPSDALRLDAFEGDAGAGGFYSRCGWCEVGRTSYRGTRLIYYEFRLG
jgi:GNAT superfamily N-acetyltransferase